MIFVFLSDDIILSEGAMLIIYILRHQTVKIYANINPYNISINLNIQYMIVVKYQLYIIGLTPSRIERKERRKMVVLRPLNC